MSKYKNKKTMLDGIEFDSKKEADYYAKLVMLMHAKNTSERVERIDRQVVFELIPKQKGEREVCYRADFVVTYGDGRQEVVDVKSAYTRKLPAYVLKRKMLLHRHGIRLKEVY